MTGKETRAAEEESVVECVRCKWPHRGAGLGEWGVTRRMVRCLRGEHESIHNQPGVCAHCRCVYRPREGE